MYLTSATVYLIPILIISTLIEAKYSRNLVSDEVSWILRLQKSTGSITMNTHARGSTAWINPYNNNFALTNILRLNTTASTLNQVQKYITWYLSHLNDPDKWGVSGTIYEYEVNQDDKEVSKNNADSTDSFAATFLSLVKSYLDASGNRNWVRDRLTLLKKVANAIWATYDSSIGLTYAKPDYKIAYLMDNAEVWRGLEDFSILLANLDDSDAEHYQYRADLIRSGIESKLWNKERGEYQYYYSNPPNAIDWSKFYPDASANMWPQLMKLPEAMRSPRRLDLYKKFANAQIDKWSQLKIGDFPFCSIGEVVKLNEKPDRAKNLLETFGNNIMKKFYPNRLWPWYVAESSWFAIILNDN